jgi:hypothetical protein
MMNNTSAVAPMIKKECKKSALGKSPAVFRQRFRERKERDGSEGKPPAVNR